MKKKLFSFGLLVGFGLAFSLVLSGCSLSGSGSSSGVFYKVEYYTDYVGIDYDAPMNVYDSSEPGIAGGILIGHDYVSVKDSDKSRPTHFSDDSIYDPTTKSSGTSAYDSKSNQADLATGYHYAFKGWTGYYEGRVSALSSSSTSVAVDQSVYPSIGDPVSMTFIRDNCKLFAHFVAEPNSYSIKLQNYDKTVLYSIEGQYLTAPDAAALQTIESISDPSHNAGGVDPYYKSWAFEGWKDQSGAVAGLLTTDEIKAELLSGQFTEDMTFVAQYADPTLKMYTVSYYQTDASENPTSIKLGSQTLTYGSPIDWATAQTTVGENPSQFDLLGNPYLENPTAHRSNVFKGWKGNYGEGGSVPTEIAGSFIETSYIRFDCDLYAYYDMDVPERFTVNFYAAGADLSTNPTPLCTKIADYGDPVAYTGAEQTLADHTFVGWEDSFGIEPDLSSVKTNLDLFATFVSDSISASDPALGTFTYTYMATDKGYRLTAFAQGTSTEILLNSWGLVSLPDGFPLTSLGDEAFKGSAITKIELPSGVQTIGEKTFSDCLSLLEADLDDDLLSIGSSAFSGCASLAEASFPSSLRSLGNYAFSGCSSLSEATYEGTSSLTSIGNSAFRGCEALGSFEIPSTVSFVDAYAFAYAGSPLRIYCRASSCPVGWNIYWNDDGGIVYWYSQTAPTVSGDYWHEVGGSILAWPSSLGFTFTLNSDESTYTLSYFDDETQEVAIPATYNGKPVVAIGSAAFKGCLSLMSVIIPEGIVSIGSEAFANCASLIHIGFPSTLTSVSDEAFYGNLKLAEVQLPASLLSLGDYAFANCSSLANLAFASLSQLSSLGDYCFSGDLVLAAFSFPDSVASIGEKAFANCSSLTSLSLPASMQTIGGYLIYGCSSLASLSVGVTAAEAASRSYDAHWNYLSDSTYVDITYAI